MFADDILLFVEAHDETIENIYVLFIFLNLTLVSILTFRSLVDYIPS